MPSKNKSYVRIILIAVIISLLLEILFGGYLAATLATWPLIRKWGIIRPEAPIVINRRETVRVSDSNDIHDASESVKSKLSVIVSAVDGQTIMTGAAVNLTSDGLFLTGKSAVGGDLGNYRVVLQDGRWAPLVSAISDPASEMVIVKAEIGNVSVANIGSSKDAASGQRILFIYNIVGDSRPVVDPNFVTFPQRQGLNQVFNADRPSRGFGVQPVASLVPGEAIVDLSGAVLGMWDGSAVISTDVMRPAFQQALADSAGLARPGFGFSYEFIDKTQAELEGLSSGVQVTQVVSAGAAQAAGLQVGDIIAKVDDTNVGQDPVFEQILERYKSGDRISLTVLRDKQSATLTLTVK